MTAEQKVTILLDQHVFLFYYRSFV